ncbi:hypothetical protein [Acetobacter malorum]|uniref:hypothetical protein n=1 Tax=Acetobacter malorum TaxID=178901 RepID=UPI0039EC3C1D
MPYDTNGNYSLPTIYYAISGTVINPSQHNTPLEDVQAALNRTLLRDGSAPLTGPLNANSNKITGVADGTNNTDVATFRQISGLMAKSDADKRYLINNGANNGGIVSADMDASGVPSFRSGAGDWYPVQLRGDYATNDALNAEVQRASNIESNLQSGKVSRAGDTITGGLTITGSEALTVSADPGGQTNGQTTNYGGLTSRAGGRGATFGFYVQELVGSAFNGVISLGFPDGSYRFFGMPGKSGRLNDSALGALAYMSDLPEMANYALVSQLPLDPSKIILAWNGYVGGGDQSIPYPRGVSSVDSVVVSCSRQVSGSKASAIINVQGWGNASVQVNTVWVGGSSQGNADVNFQAILVGNK